MSNWETLFYWIMLVIYSLASGGYIYSFIFKNSRVVPKLTFFTAVGFAFHCAAIGARYLAQGHLPWAGDYENAMMGGWFIIAGSFLVGWRNKALQGLAAVTVPLVVIMLGFGIMRNPALAPMAANLKSIWLYIHVYFAWLAFGSYTLAMAAGVLYLLKRRNTSKGCVNPTFESFPSLERLDELIFKYVVFGFIMDSIMITAGSIWAKDLWGSYWSWDPIETWSLVAWLTYGFFIHMRVIFGWRDASMAWLAIFALSLVGITFFGVNLFEGTSLHVFQTK